MKRNIKVLFTFLLIAIITIAGAKTTYAAEPSLQLKADVTEAKIGDTISIDVTAKNDNGIEGLDSILEYDSTKLEFTNKTDVEDATMSQADGETGDYKLIILVNSASTVTEKKLVTLKFKVLDKATVGETLKVTVKNIKMADSNENQNEIANQEVSIKVISGESQEPQTTSLKSIKVTTQPTKKSYTEGDKFDPTGMVIMAEYSDGTTKTITGYTVTNGGKLVSGQTSVTISYKDGDVTKETTQAITVSEYKSGTSTGTGTNTGNQTPSVTKTTDDSASSKEIPKTGLASIVLPAIVLGIIAGISYIAYKKSNV